MAEEINSGRIRTLKDSDGIFYPTTNGDSVILDETGETLNEKLNGNITANNILFSTFTASPDAAMVTGGWHLDGTAYNTDMVTQIKVPVTVGASNYMIMWNCELVSASWIDIRPVKPDGGWYTTRWSRWGISRGSTLSEIDIEGTPVGGIAVDSYAGANGFLTSSHHVSGNANFRYFSGYATGGTNGMVFNTGHMSSDGDDFIAIALCTGANMLPSARLTVWSWSPASGDK